MDGDEVLEGEMENQLRNFKETVIRPAKRRVEQVFRLLLGEVHPGSWVRFAEMDVTDLRADGEFFDKMLSAGVFSRRRCGSLWRRCCNRRLAE